MIENGALRLTQHKRFVPWGTRPNPALYALSEGKRFCRMNAVRFHNESKLYGLEGWASFMLETLTDVKGDPKTAIFNLQRQVIDWLA